MSDVETFDTARILELMTRSYSYGTLRDRYLNDRIDAAEFEQRLDALLADDPRAIERWDSLHGL